MKLYVLKNDGKPNRVGMFAGVVFPYSGRVGLPVLLSEDWARRMRNAELAPPGVVGIDQEDRLVAIDANGDAHPLPYKLPAESAVELEPVEDAAA